MSKQTNRNENTDTMGSMSSRWLNALRPRPNRTIETGSQTMRPGHPFNWLPTEVLHIILDKLTVQDLSVFSMVSKEAMQYIVAYISTVTWRKRTIFRRFHTLTDRHNTSAEHYKNLGLLFKRCTLLIPTKERLKFVFSIFSQIPCFMLGKCISPNCFAFSRYGIFIQTLIAGWDELECLRVFQYLCDITHLLEKTGVVLSVKPGSKPSLELQIRLFCRRVLLDQWSNANCQFWLTQLLKPWPVASQAHLLFILYGPMLPDGTLDWLDMADTVLPHFALWDLAKAVLLVYGKLRFKGWTTHTMLTVLEELTAVPQPWHMENTARLLVLCGGYFSYVVLASKAVRGRLFEVTRLIVHILLVCEKDGYQINWPVNLVHQLLKIFRTNNEKFFFIQQLENCFTEVTREFFELTLAGDYSENREVFRNLCILMESTAQFHSRLLYAIISKK